MGNDARKYVDLLYKATGRKHANWDPPKLVEVGDWGYVEKTTGNFVKEGNIFTDKDCSDALEHLDKTVLSSSPEDLIRFDVNAVSAGGGNLSAGLGSAGDVDIKVKLEWTFSSENRGAVIAARNVTTTYLEHGIIFPKLDDVQKLKGKAIVVETLTCPAYALLLTDKGCGGSASLTLDTKNSATGENGAWEPESETGVWRTAYGDLTDEKAVKGRFTPLFALKKTAKRFWPIRFRGGTDIIYEYEEYELPWKTLDEDGEEK
ncbi:hypothetical protein FRC09_002797 [Ceratobasidium sp. 395]|nr:hypothetical protein FRC09_002797 [Ceratobasidium sp. 395]